MPYLGIFGLEFEKENIVIFENNVLEFALWQGLVQK